MELVHVIFCFFREGLESQDLRGWMACLEFKERMDYPECLEIPFAVNWADLGLRDSLE